MGKRTPRQSKAGVLNCSLGMSKPFDIELDRLTGRTSYSEAFPIGAAGQRGTFFLETFGCQMNDHDSEKVAGLLLSRGYQQVETPEAASLILYNTCSIREKPRKKFSRAWVNTGKSRVTPRLSECWAAWRNRKAKVFLSAHRG